MTGAEIIPFVGVILALFGAMFGVWKYVDAKITAARKDAEIKADSAAELARLTHGELAAHKLHIAENYVSKQGLKETRDEILKAVGGLRDDFRHLTSRLDSLHERKPD